MVDWKKLKAEYIAGGTSYRKLAEKYGEPRSNIERRAKAEKWTELRRQAEVKATSIIVDSISNRVAEKAERIIDAADGLLEKIMELARDVDDPQSIRYLTSALKDIKDIKGYKSDADMREQEARIDKLRRDADKGDGEEGKPCGVVLMPPVMPQLTPREDSDG